MNKVNKNDFDIEKAKQIFYDSLLYDPEDEEQIEQIDKKQIEAIRYAQNYARVGNNDAKRFIIVLAQGKSDTMGSFCSARVRDEAFQSIYHFFGSFIKKQCISKFKSTNPNASYDEMNNDVNEAMDSVWLEILNDFQSYDPSIAEFSTWARGRIMGGIQNYIAEKKGRKSKTTLQTDKEVYNACEHLKACGILKPSEILIAQKTGLSVETVRNSLIRMKTENQTVSIESMYTNNDGDGYKELNIGETMTPLSEDLYSPEKQLLLKEKQQMLLHGIHLLSEDERKVLSLYQGICFDNEEISSFVDNKSFSIPEICEILDLPENKVVNLYSNALNKLKNYIEKESSDVEKEPHSDTFLSKRTMLFSNRDEDDELLQIINSIDDITD